MEAILYKITLWSFFAGMIAHFLSFFPKEGKRSGKVLLVAAYLLIAAGFASLTATIVSRWIAQGRVPISSSYEYLSVLAWFVSVIYFIVMYKVRSQFIGACISPGLFLVVVFAGLYPLRLEMTLVPALQSYWLQIHVSMTIMGEAAFALAFLTSILYLIKNVEWGRVNSQVRSRSLQLFLVSTGAGLVVAFLLRTSGLILVELAGWQMFVALVGGGFLLTLPLYVILWRRWVKGETGNFGGLVFALSVLALMASGMSLGSYYNKVSQRLEELMLDMRAVDDMTAAVGSTDGTLELTAWQQFSGQKKARLDLILGLEQLQAERKHSLSRQEAESVLAGTELLNQLSFPISLGEIREQRQEARGQLEHLNRVAGRTGIPVSASSLRSLRTGMVNEYNQIFSSSLIPLDEGQEAAFMGYIVLFAIPLFAILYHFARRVQLRIPELETLDSLAYRTVSLGFPIFTFGAL
ncbi:MAG TPA: cytochrome c biogenesis protein CcsA, partial [Candidatus Glassbacteria bacterium]|nr:cytochrome c biogenesis protein CcsA [Candidatus Glassbacteria bacterium]